MVDVTLDRLLELQDQAETAYKIIVEELKRDSIEAKLIQAFIYPDIKTVGVKGDSRVYQYPLFVNVLKQDGTPYFDYDFFRRISKRITSEVEEITRVVVAVGGRNSSNRRTNAEVDYEMKNLTFYYGEEKHL